MNAARIAAIAGAMALCLALAGCTSGNDGGPAQRHLADHGPITYAEGLAGADVVRPLIDEWNAAHPAEKVTLVVQPSGADAQHADLVRLLGGKGPATDVVDLDVVWTAEFAAKGWLQPLRGGLRPDNSALVPTVVRTTGYDHAQYGVPLTTDGGLLYYRKDLVPSPPATWADLLADCRVAVAHRMGCYGGQFAPGEDLTANVVEAIATAGGGLLGEDDAPTEPTRAQAAGLRRLADAAESGVIPPEATSFDERQSREAFAAGRLLFLRDWSSAYRRLAADGGSTVANGFGAAPLPGISDLPGASSLGGRSAAISVGSTHKATAIAFIEFLQSDPAQRRLATEASLAPVLAALYTDAELAGQLPYLPTLQTSIANGVPRPAVAYYPALSEAVQRNASAAITGDKTVDAALTDLSSAIRAVAHR